MNEEANLSHIEDRLRADAGRLLIGVDRPDAKLWNEYQCRRRRVVRRRLAAAALSAATFSAVVAGLAVNEEPLPPPHRHAIAASRPAMQTLVQPRNTAAMATPHAKNFDGPLPPMAIPFVIGEPDSVEPAVTGYYVPERVEPIDVRQLSPAERDAVRAVMDIDDSQNGGVI